jgi:hypothetical protein
MDKDGYHGYEKNAGINTAAFPTYFTGEHALSMTLRDYFAAKAMQGLLSGLLADSQDLEWAVIARNAYWQADAMLKAREL